MPESGTYGSVPGAPSNGRPYGDHPEAVVSLGADLSTGGVAHATQTPTVVKSSRSCADSTSSELRLSAAHRLHELRARCRLGPTSG